MNADRCNDERNVFKATELLAKVCDIELLSRINLPPDELQKIADLNEALHKHLIGVSHLERNEIQGLFLESYEEQT